MLTVTHSHQTLPPKDAPPSSEPVVLQCRCCLSLSNEHRSIDQEIPFQSPVKMRDMLAMFAGVYSTSALAPNHICDICGKRLIDAHSFYQQCLQAQTQLLAHESRTPKQCNPTTTKGKLPRPVRIRPAASSQTPPSTSLPTRRICRTCNERFASKSDLERHRRQRHLHADRSWHCSACSIQFYTAVSYGRHLQLHADNICLFCNIGFTAAADLHDHVTAQHIDNDLQPDRRRRFTCVQCARAFWTRRALLRHFRSMHDASGVSFMCGVCLKVSFRRRSELRSHLAECVAPTADMRVDDAANAALNFGGLDDDMPVEFLNYSLLGGVEDMDDDCCFDASYMDGMVEEFLDDAFQMPATTATTSGTAADLLDMMIQQATSDGRRDSNAECRSTASVAISGAPPKHSYACPRCGVIAFGSQRELHLHLASVHNEPVLVCNQCGTGFTSMTALTEHRAQHKVENRLANESLTRLFEAKDDHITDREAHRFVRYADPSGNDPTLFVYSCRACARVYKTKANAMRHQCRSEADAATMGTTTAVQPAIPVSNTTTTTTTTLLCSLCDKSFRTLGGLKYHLLTHTSSGEKSFHCAYCSERFLTGINLAAHLRARHSSAKPQQCDQCPLGFTTGTQLRRHMAVVHGGRRDHVCNVCGKAYTQRSHLRHHEWTHSGVKKFACGQCERAFTSRTSLRKHEEKVHASGL